MRTPSNFFTDALFYILIKSNLGKLRRRRKYDSRYNIMFRSLLFEVLASVTLYNFAININIFVEILAFKHYPSKPK